MPDPHVQRPSGSASADPSAPARARSSRPSAASWPPTLRARRGHQRHLHRRGRPVPALGRRPSAGADRGRRDRRLPAHGDPRRRHRQPDGRRGPRAAASRRWTSCWSSPAATTSPRRSPPRWSTPRSSSSTWPAAATSPARAARASTGPTCSSSTRPTSRRTSGWTCAGWSTTPSTPATAGRCWRSPAPTRARWPRWPTGSRTGWPHFRAGDLVPVDPGPMAAHSMAMPRSRALRSARATCGRSGSLDAG